MQPRSLHTVHGWFSVTGLAEMQISHRTGATMKRLTATQNPITKVTQTFQRADGSEARITSCLDAIFGGKPHITVERRGGPEEPWSW